MRSSARTLNFILLLSVVCYVNSEESIDETSLSSNGETSNTNTHIAKKRSALDNSAADVADTLFLGPEAADVLGSDEESTDQVDKRQFRYGKRQFRYGKRQFRYGKRDSDSDLDLDSDLSNPIDFAKRQFRYGKRGTLLRYGKRSGTVFRHQKRGGTLFRFGRSGAKSSLPSYTKADLTEAAREIARRELLTAYYNDILNRAEAESVAKRDALQGFHWGSDE